MPSFILCVSYVNAQCSLNIKLLKFFIQRVKGTDRPTERSDGFEYPCLLPCFRLAVARHN